MVMPLFPHGATHIDKLSGFSRAVGTVTYFSGGMPVFSHPEADRFKQLGTQASM